MPCDLSTSAWPPRPETAAAHYRGITAAGGGAGTAKRGGAESAPSSHAPIRGCSPEYSVEYVVIKSRVSAVGRRSNLTAE